MLINILLLYKLTQIIGETAKRQHDVKFLHTYAQLRPQDTSTVCVCVCVWTSDKHVSSICELMCVCVGGYVYVVRLCLWS